MKKIITLLFATLFATAIYAAESPIVWLLTMQTPTISCWNLGAKSPKALRHISSTTTVPVDVTDVTTLITTILK